MKSIVPKSFEELFKILNLRSVSGDDYEYFFRGCCTNNWKYNLVPGIYRNNQIGKEDIKFKELILRSPKDFIDERTTLEKLVKIQHYTLPTRLLDITSNPLVALYFACLEYDKNHSTNGTLYVFKIHKDNIKYYDSDAVSLISNLAKLNIPKTNFKGGFGYLLYEVQEEKPHFSVKGFDDEIKEDIRKVFPVKVKLNNNRIVSQSGAFLIFGIRHLTSKKLSAVLPSYHIDKKIMIKKKLKGEILDILKKLSINENTLFPELEHQANYLIRS